MVTLESEGGSAEMSVCTELALGVVVHMFSRFQRAGIMYFLLAKEKICYFNHFTHLYFI